MKVKEAYQYTLSIIMNDADLQLVDVKTEEVILNKKGFRAMYTFTKQCEEIHGLHLEDGTKKIFLNMSSKNGRKELVKKSVHPFS